MDSLQINTLGGLTIRHGGDLVTGFASRKAELLLVYLACNPRSHRREILADLLWDYRTQKRAQGNLRVVLSSLRKVVGPFVTITRDTAGINTDAVWLDAAELEAALAAQVTTETAEEMGDALDLYRDDFLAGVHVRDARGLEAWLVNERERLHRLVLGGYHRLVDYYLEIGDYRPGIARATRLLELDPLLEAGHRQMMSLLARSGQRAAALAQYEHCCHLLAEELGVEPVGETTALYEAIRDGSLPEVAAPSSAPAPMPSVGSLPGFLAESGSEEAGDAVFVARESELAWLTEHLTGVLAGEGRILFVTGEAGTGKTALLHEFARRASEAHPRLLVAAGRGSALGGRGDPYLSFRQILAQLTGDVEGALATGHLTAPQATRLWRSSVDVVADLLQHGPGLVNRLLSGPPLLARMEAATGGGGAWLAPLRELARQDMQSLAETTDLQQQVTAVFQTWARRRPLLLLLDDVHWADSVSLDLLFHLCHHLAGHRILVAAAHRPEDVKVDGEPRVLTRVLNEARRRFGDVELPLDPAVRRQGRDFVDALLDGEPNRLGESFRQEMLRRTGGHPLFTVELLRAMQSRGDLVLDGEGRWAEGETLDWQQLPAQVEGVIGERVSRVPPEARRLLEIASVEGEAFTAEVLATVLDVDARQVQRQLSGELDRRYRLVRAEGRETVGGQHLAHYRFRHALFREYLYGQLDEVERAYLHEDVGLALEVLHAGETATVVPQLAYHFSQAGVTGKAIAYAQEAGDAARLLYAHEEAIEYYQHALSFLKDAGEYDQAARALMKLGLTYHQAFHYQEARGAYEEAFSLWQQMPDLETERPGPAPHPLRIGSWEATSTDPGLAFDAVSVELVAHLFAGLVDLAETGEIVPDLATRWEIRDRGHTYIFHLRPHACWSDGTPLTAHDFDFAWRRVLAPASEAALAPLLYDVVGAEAYHRGEIDDPDQIGIFVPDEHTFIVRLRQPTAYFLGVVATPVTAAVPRHVVATAGESWTDAATFVGSGSFLLDSYRPGKRIELVRNPHYHHPFTGNVERVVIHAFSTGQDDWQEPARLYEADELDVITGFYPPQAGDFSRFKRRHIDDFVVTSALSSHALAFNWQQSPFSDASVRQAFALAIDKESFVRATRPVNTLPATGGLVPPGIPGNTPDTGLPFDPDRARHLLSQAGFPGGRGFPRVTMTWPEWPSTDQQCAWLVQQWKRFLGVSVGWRLLPNGYFAAMRRNPSPISLMAWGADYLDPDNFLRVAILQGYNTWPNERYSRLVEQARRLRSQLRRLALYQEADRILTGDAYIVPLAYEGSLLLLKPWVKHSRTGVGGTFSWKSVMIGPH